MLRRCFKVLHCVNISKIIVLYLVRACEWVSVDASKTDTPVMCTKTAFFNRIGEVELLTTQVSSSWSEQRHLFQGTDNDTSTTDLARDAIE